MNLRLTSLLLSCLLATLAHGTDTNVLLTTARALFDRSVGAPTPPVPFDLTATVVRGGTQEVAVADSSGIVFLHNMRRKRLNPGDVIHVCGWLDFEEFGHPGTKRLEKLEVIGHRSPPPPEKVSLDELQTRRTPFLAETEGIVTDVFRDEIDERNTFISLRDGTFKLNAALPRQLEPNPAALLGARIRVYGFYCRVALSFRTYVGSVLMVNGKPEILVPAPRDPFDASPLSFYPVRTPEEIDRLPRQSATGRVLSAWRGNHLLVQTDSGPLLGAELLEGTPLPRIGETVRLVGKPATDLFHINLVQAICRTEATPAETSREPAEDIVPAELIVADNLLKGPAVPRYHGHTVRLTGIVRNVQDSGTPKMRLNLNCDNLIVPVYPGFAPASTLEVAAGSRVSVTGICIFDAENWQPNRIFPRLAGPSVILRDSSDLTLLSRPPWWTPGHLVAAIAILLAGLVSVWLWNRALNRLVNRRGHELAREKLKKESAQLKIAERTRLAVELHDSLSQNLEGVACQIAATRNVLASRPGAAASWLETTERMLDSCRLELRRCLFDLRGQALEERDFTTAIRKTLAPLCDGIALAIRFDVRRTLLDDTATHAVLCMIRELVSNALRHGKATRIRIAGECHGGTLCFSVRDNGCGFDVRTQPGPHQGHFGLAGVRERADHFDGSVTLDASPGKGARITVTLKLKKT